MIILRKIHIKAGVVLAFFIFLQAGSGILMSLSRMFNDFSFELVHQIHHGGDLVGSIYRVMLGIGLIFMVLSGGFIFIQTKKIMKKNLQ